MREVPPAIRVLVAEHDLCRHFLEAAASALAHTTSNQMRATETALAQVWSLLEFLEGGLETHIAKEEGPLFPRLKAALPVDDRLIDEMVAEHDLIRMKRGDLRGILVGLLDGHDAMRLDSKALRTSLTGYLQSQSLTPVQHALDIVGAKLRVHFENEEELVFPLASVLLSSGELTEINTEMSALGDPAPAN